MLANRYVPLYPRESPPHVSLGRSQCSRSSEEQHSSPNRPAEETLTLTNFTLKYVQSLPLQISVVKGYYGCDERHSIATGDVYNVHFVKRNKVALLKDSGGKIHRIPLNSAVQFGLIFHPIGNPRVALQGFYFERVSDIMAQIQLPKVIQTTKSHKRSDTQSSVEEHEILIVQKIVHNAMRRKALQVYSITRREQKILDSDCLGGFITDPYTNRLHLPDIIEHLSDDFPLEVLVIVEDGNMPENVPYDITTEASFLTGVDTEASLIASTPFEKDEDDKQKPVEIPVDLQIDVKVIQLKGAELEKLYAYTRKLYERFDPFSTLSIKTSSSELCTGVRSGFEREGLELQRPDSVYNTLASFLSPAVLQRMNASATHKQSGPSTPQPPPLKPKPQSRQHQPLQTVMEDPPVKDSKKKVRHNYTPLVIRSPTRRQSYEICMPKRSLLRRNGSLLTTKCSETGTSTSPSNLIEFGKLLARVELLEKEVCSLRSEIATLKSQGMSTCKYLIYIIMCIVGCY